MLGVLRGVLLEAYQNKQEPEIKKPAKQSRAGKECSMGNKLGQYHFINKVNNTVASLHVCLHDRCVFD